MKRKHSGGFTMIEVLVVVAIVAILAAIAIANYLGAVNRAKQKRTVADMRSIALAWESFSNDTGSYSAAGFTMPATVVPYATLKARLSPTYSKALPEFDGWSRPFAFYVSPDPAGKSTDYAIRSRGRDGVVDGTTYTPGAFTDPDNDIVFANGNFVAYPEVMQDSN